MHKCHLLIVYFTFSIFINKYLFTVGFMPFYKKNAQPHAKKIFD